VVICYGVKPCAVLGLDEKGGGGEFAVWPWAVLGGDCGFCGGGDLPLSPAYTLSPTVYRAERGRYGLLAFGDEAFIRVQVVAARGLA
jgi:hypothetical protein